MEKSDHVALTLSSITTATDELRPRKKNLRRSWNQLPRCQRNLIILGILALFIMFLFYRNLPADQIFSENKKQFAGALPFQSESQKKPADDTSNQLISNSKEEDKEDNNLKAVLGPPIFKEQHNIRQDILPPPVPPPKSDFLNKHEPDTLNQQNVNNEVIEHGMNSVGIPEINVNNIEVPTEANLVIPLQPAQHEKTLPKPLNEIDMNTSLRAAISNPLVIPSANGLSIDEYIATMDVRKTPTKQHFHGASNERQNAVVAAFRHSWNGYKKYAWGHDNLKPISLTWHDWFGLGLTIVDALDTMYIMGLEEEFEEAREWVKESLVFDQNRYVNLFEVTIRVLGGLLSSYHLSGDTVFLKKSIELGNRLLPSFVTPSGIPFSDVHLAEMRANVPKWSPDSSTSEVTTIQLEFRDLSRISNISIYEQVSYAVSEKIHALEKTNGLVPIFINANVGTFRSFSTISLGARGDSYYEYLLKQWIQTGRKENDFLIADYMQAIDGILTKLMRRTPHEQHVYIGEILNGKDFKPKMDHLTCYLPGTLLLGHKYGMPESHFLLARDLLETCYQTYMRQPTHLAPEITYFAVHNNEEHDIYVKPNDAHNLLRPEFVESLYYFYAITGNRTYQEMGWNIFQAFEKHTKTAAGYTSINNVKNVLNTKARDMMESFWLGETLKYFYLLFSDNTKEINLDKWIFNTEAHLVPIRNS